MPIGVCALVFSYKYTGTINQPGPCRGLSVWNKISLLSNDMLIYIHIYIYIYIYICVYICICVRVCVCVCVCVYKVHPWTGHMSHRGSRGIALPFHDHGTRRGWGVSAMPHAPAALYPRKRPGTHCTGGWVGPRAGLDRCRKSRPDRDSIPGPSSS